MKVLRFSPEFNLGKEMNRGLSMNVFYLVKALKKLGVKQHIFTPSTNAEKWEDVEITKVKQRSRFSIIMAGIDAYKIIKNEKCDIIHTHNYGFFTLYHFKKKLGVLFVHSIHGSPFDIKYQPIRNFKHFKEMLYNLFFNLYCCIKADEIIVMTNNYKRDLVKYFRINPNKIHFIPPQVDAKIFKPIKIKKDIDLIYTGRFVTLKHVPFVVDVVNILKKKKPDIKCYLVGGSEKDNEYNLVMDKIKKYGLEKNVYVVGPTEHRKMISYYNRSKVLIFVAFSHGVGKTLIEAMACELPFVTNMKPAEGEYSFTDKEGFAGLSIKVEVFADRIYGLLINEKLRKEKGRAARKKVLIGYTPEITSKRTFELYKKLLN